MRVAKRDLQGHWQPDGGQILRDAKGLPTGVFIDAAMDLVEAEIPAMDEAATERALALLERAMPELKARAKDLNELGDDAKQFVRKSPALALGIAAVAGFLVSRLFKGGSNNEA